MHVVYVCVWMDVESDCEEVQTPAMWDDNNRYIKRVVIQQKQV